MLRPSLRAIGRPGGYYYTGQYTNVWFCIPPIGSSLAPFPAIAEAGGSKTEQSPSTLI